MRCRLSRKILVNSQINYTFHIKSVQREEFRGDPINISNFPKAAMEAPQICMKGMPGTKEFMLGPTWELIIP